MIDTKDRQISDLLGTVEILKARMTKMQDLLELKDKKLQSMSSFINGIEKPLIDTADRGTRSDLLQYQIPPPP